MFNIATAVLVEPTSNTAYGLFGANWLLDSGIIGFIKDLFEGLNSIFFAIADYPNFC